MFVRKPKWELGIQSSAEIWQNEEHGMRHDHTGRMSILLCVVRIHHKLHAADLLVPMPRHSGRHSVQSARKDFVQCRLTVTSSVQDVNKEVDMNTIAHPDQPLLKERR